MAEKKRGEESGEERLIARFFRPLATHPGALGLADDAAIFSAPADHDTVLTADTVVENVHFLSDDPPQSVARKALRVNLSDLAAKAAKPAGFLLSLSLPERISEDWLQPFSDALQDDAKDYGCPLFGGDSVRAPDAINIAVFAFGFVPRGKMVRRLGARPGDAVFVTGTIGDAALGLRLRRDAKLAARWKLSPQQGAHLISRYRVPQPRLPLGETLRRCASAAMDVSDGLAGDLAKLCRASTTGAKIAAADVPLSSAARAALAADPALLESVLTGGDDYEIICTVPPEKAEDFRNGAANVGVAVSEIGRVTAGQGEARFLDAKGSPLHFTHLSYSHF